jgi:hypothetical protein
MPIGEVVRCPTEGFKGLEGVPQCHGRREGVFETRAILEGQVHRQENVPRTGINKYTRILLPPLA